MRVLALTLSVLLVLPSSAQECPIPRKAFLLVGQSNMVGNAPAETADTIPIPSVIALKYWPPANSWVVAKDPLSSGVSIGVNFGRAYQETNGDEVIALVPMAVGGSSIIAWAEGMNNFEKAVAAGQIPTLFPLSATLAAQLPKPFQVAAILWHQGEADATSSRSIPSFDYTGKLAAVLQAMRNRLGLPDVPVVLGEIAPLNAYSVAINGYIHDASALLPNSAVVGTGDLTTLTDGVHFDAASTRELGRRYFAAYQALAPPNPTPSPSPTPTTCPSPSPVPEPYCVLAYR